MIIYVILCNICGKNLIIEENNNNNNSYISCINDEFHNILCYNTCKYCEIEGNETQHNCIECKDDYIYEINITNSNYKNCFMNKNFTIENNTYKNTNLNNSSNPITSTDSKNSVEFIKSLTTYIINNIENRTEIIQHIIDDLINEFNMTEITNGEDKKIIDKDKIIILTSTENQKNNEDKNNITMNLGQCENILKKDYNISNNNSLYILQIISEEEGMKIPKVEYEVYYPLNDNNLTKLNLTLCKGTKIEISIAVKINDSLDKYNLKSDYYNDICSTTTSESGTDISLKDRKNEFINNNMSLCEENCDLIEYNITKEKAKCSCDIKLSIPQNYDIKFNKNDFFKRFTDVKNMFNLNIIKCYKIFKLEKLMKNYGFFIVGSIIILYFINLLIFINYSYDKIKKEIDKIKKEIFNIILALKTNTNQIQKNKIINIENINKINNKKKKKKKKKKKYNKNKIKQNENRNEKIEIKLNYKKLVTQNISGNSLTIINKINNYKIYKNSINININNINSVLQKKDFELNSLNYIGAIKSDQRTYCEYYISLVKYNHPIIFSFVPFDDYNSQIIKFLLFFFSFCSDFAINALFFTDDTMHKIYEDKGKFDLIYQIPQIIYSSLISKIIDTFIKNLALSQDNIVELKQLKQNNNLKLIQNKLLRILKIKFAFFFISSFIILFLFMYYLTCFCGIYINTQIHLIKDSIMSLIISLVIPFILYLIPGIFRITSLKTKKPNRMILYKLSQYIEICFC